MKSENSDSSIHLVKIPQFDYYQFLHLFSMSPIVSLFLCINFSPSSVNILELV